MSLYGVYDFQNIFVKIICGEVFCYKVYEDEDVFVFFDLFLQFYGYILVIFKYVEVCNLFEIDVQNLVKVMVVVQCLICVLVEEVQLDGVQVVQFNGVFVGQMVFYIYFYVILCFSGENFGIYVVKQGDLEVFV